MAEGQLSAEALEQVTQHVEQTMMNQQAQLLEIAGKNTLELLRDHQRQSKPTLLNSIDEEIQNTVNTEHTWKSDINEKNHSNLKQIELMWRRTERFVATLEVPPAQQEIKDGALSFIQKGKELTHERIKVIRFADRDGWSAALRYLGDDIAETEAEAKAMRKSKKDVESRPKDSSHKGERRYTPYSSTTHVKREPGTSTSLRERGDYSGRAPGHDGYRQYQSNKVCYECGRRGHIARNCDRR